MDNTLKKLKIKIQQKRNLLLNLAEWEKNIIVDIKEMELKLWDICDHEWIRDTFAMHDDLCKWQCKYCTLWRDRGIYSN